MVETIFIVMLCALYARLHYVKLERDQYKNTLLMQQQSKFKEVLK